MLDGYNRSFNKHGGQIFLRPAAIPDIKLAIGYGEVMNPLTNKQIFAGGNPGAGIVGLGIRTDDDLARLNLGKPHSIADFPAQYYLGEGL